MEHELTVEERLTFENLKLKRQLIESETRAFMAGILRKHGVSADSVISFTDTHLVVMSELSGEREEHGEQ